MQIAIAWVLLFASGCATVVIPPAHVAAPSRVYILDYGRHASLLLPRDAGYVEYAFGHWKWFAEGRYDWYRVPFILFIPGQSTLSRRELGPIANTKEAQERAEAPIAHELIVEQASEKALLTRLDQRFQAAIQTRVDGPDHMEYVKDPDIYWGWHNSNTVTAEWVRELGADVRGPTLISTFELKPATSAN